jgi:hypothetical protein
MPLEVRQIGIRLSVGGPDPAQADDGLPDGSAASALPAAQRARLVEECVEAVLATLKAREER